MIQSGLLLCFCRYVLKCVYARLYLSVDLGIDVAKILINVVFNVIAKLSKNDVFGFAKSDKLSVLVKNFLLS